MVGIRRTEAMKATFARSEFNPGWVSALAGLEGTASDGIRSDEGFFALNMGYSAFFRSPACQLRHSGYE
jgi:hypothetical protein